MRLNNTCGAWTLKMGIVDIWIWVYDLKQRQWKNKAQRSCDFCTCDMENNTTGVLTWVFFRMITLLYSKVCIHSWSILLLCEVRTVNSGSPAFCGGGVEEALVGQCSLSLCTCLPAVSPVLEVSGRCYRNLAPCLSFLCSRWTLFDVVSQNH